MLAPLPQDVHGNQTSFQMDAHLIGGDLHIQRVPAVAVGHAVAVSADANAALAADMPLLAQDGIATARRQSQQARTLFLEVFQHHALGARVCPIVGHGIGPVVQLTAHVLQLLQRTGMKKSARMQRNGHSTLPLVLAR